MHDPSETAKQKALIKEPFLIYYFAFVHASPNIRKQHKQERKQGRKNKKREKGNLRRKEERDNK